MTEQVADTPGESEGQAPRSRLAPSPTGVLHLGNARTFLLNWLHVRRLGGSIALRVEDIDGPRVKEGAEEALLADLRWLGLDWDGVLVRQSDRLDRYRVVVDALLARGLAYACVCTRSEVEAAASAPHEAWRDATPYPGTCREKFSSREHALEESGREPAVRFRVEVDAVGFEDAFRGSETGRIAGDFVIEKRDRGPAYQLAVVVDDAAEGVDYVLRGDDLLASTPRQLLLYRVLGLPEPRFAHVPLLVGGDGKRLAKRHGDTSLAHFRRSGITRGQVLTYLGRVSELDEEALEGVDAARDLVAGFELARVPRSPVVVDSPFGVA